MDSRTRVQNASLTRREEMKLRKLLRGLDESLDCKVTTSSLIRALLRLVIENGAVRHDILELFARVLAIITRGRTDASPTVSAGPDVSIFADRAQLGAHVTHGNG